MMADGSQMRARLPEQTGMMSLEDAIRALEAGSGDGVSVDLGQGRIAAADSPRGREGLLQRLRGHRMLIALASGQADLSRLRPLPEAVQVAPAVREILDAATRRP